MKNLKYITILISLWGISLSCCAGLITSRSVLSKVNSNKLQAQLVKIIKQKNVNVEDWLDEADKLLNSIKTQELNVVENEQYQKLDLASSYLRELSKKKNFIYDSYVQNFMWGLLSASGSRAVDMKTYDVALLTLDHSIKQLRTSKREIKQQLNLISNLGLGIKFYNPLSKISKLTSELHKRGDLIYRGNISYQDMSGATLMKDQEYLNLWSKHRSCLNSFFKSTGKISSILNVENFYLDSYRAEFNKMNAKVGNPIHFMPKLYYGSYQIDQPSSKGDSSSRITSFQRNLGASIRKSVISFLDKINIGIENLKEQKSELKSFKGKRYISYNEEEKELVLSILSRAPRYFGLYSPFLKTELVVSLVDSSQSIFREKREKFSKEILVTSVLAIASAFIPGPTILYFGARAIKLGEVLYAGLVAGQIALVTNHLIDFSSESEVTNVLSLTNPHNTFFSTNNEMIDEAIWEGGLTAAFIGVGEGLGLLKFGENAVSRHLGKFLKWGHGKASYLLSRKQGVNELEKYSKLYMKNKGKVDPSKPLKVFKGKESYKWASVMIHAVEKNANFQRKLALAIKEIPGKANKEMFLDTVIENIFRLADVSSKSMHTKKGFVGLITKEMEIIKTYALSRKPFMMQYGGDITKSGPLPFTALTKKIVHMEVNAIEKGNSIASKLTRIMIAKLELGILKKMNLGNRFLYGEQKKLFHLRHHLSPFAVKYADDSKEISLAILKEVLKDKELKKALFKLSPMESFKGYDMKQAKYYYEKLLVLVDKISENYASIVSQTGIGINAKVKREIINALEKVNADPGAFMVSVLELNSVLSKMLLNLGLEDKAQNYSENPVKSISNTLNCSAI
jgi:hypothetical protein